jgi:hypothetical protein
MMPHTRGNGVKTLRLPNYRQLQSYTCGFVVAANIVHYFKPQADLTALCQRLD